MGAQLADRPAHLLQRRHGAVQAGELAQPRARPLDLQQRARQRVAREDEVRERPELDDAVVVARGLGEAVGLLARVVGARLALPRVARRAGIGKPRVTHVLGDLASARTA